MDEMRITQRKELPWDDDPRTGHYIDDNALYVLKSISMELFVGSGAQYFFFIASYMPLEWDHKTMIKFLIKASEEYGIELRNFATMTYAFSEQYEEPTFDKKTGKPFVGYEKAYKKYIEEYKKYEEYNKKHNIEPYQLFLRECKIPMPPRKYGGAYKWALDEMKKKPQTSEGQLLSKIFDNKFDLADLKKIIKISDSVLAINESKDSEKLLAKRICNDIVDWTSFEVVPDKQTAEILCKDLDDYLEKFINNKLKMGRRERKVNDILVLQNSNIYTFNKHKEMLFARFRDMQEKYGDTFVFENPFEEIPFEENSEESIQQRYAARQFLFMHIFFAFEKLGYIKIITLGNNWHWSGANDNKLKCNAKIQLLPAISKEFGIQTTLTDKKEMPVSFKPRLLIEKGVGCLQIFKQGRKHKIGGINTRKFKLIRCLFSPENTIEASYNPTLQGYERVFDAIRLPKDKRNSKLQSVATARTEMLSIIENTAKELQKIKTLQGYLLFIWEADKIRMDINMPEGNNNPA